MSALPRISLITPSYQQAEFLEECLLSVSEQRYPTLEHIVMDGGSTDGSVDIIERQAHRLSAWSSAKDHGQSDALNKGLALSTGEVFGWLNSDDALVPGSLQHVGEAFRNDPELLVHGGCIRLREDGVDRASERVNGTDTFQLFVEPVINQPATFLRLGAVRALGGVETRLRYVMDLELWWQLLFRHGAAHMRFEPVELAIFRLHGASKTVQQQRGFLDETASLLHGLCLRSGNHDLAEVLAVGYTLRHGLRPIPATAEHHDLVRSMAVHFLLKWNGTIHTAEQFRLMKAFRRLPMDGVRYLDRMDQRLPALRNQLRPANWTLFRLRRKWKHLWA